MQVQVLASGLWTSRGQKSCAKVVTLSAAVGHHNGLFFSLGSDSEGFFFFSFFSRYFFFFFATNASINRPRKRNIECNATTWDREKSNHFQVCGPLTKVHTATPHAIRLTPQLLREE